MSYRYANREVLINDNEAYRELLKERGLKYFRQFGTADLTYPTLGQLMHIQIIPHLWKAGDKYYKLAHAYYGDSRLWWVIAWFNKKPTEAHVKSGDVVNIPTPLETILSYYGV